VTLAATPLVPRLDWDPAFVGGHPAHRVLARAAACFVAAASWPDPSTWRDALERGGLAAPLLTDGGARVAFAPSPPKSKSRRRRAPVEVARIYDEQIYVRGEVPSRVGSWHDYLNMLVWATFPSAKRALNARQRAALRAHVVDGAARIPGARTREQDALSMLDEGGVVILASRESEPSVSRAIERADAEALSALVHTNGAAVFAFGHALHEHLLSSTTAIRALAVHLVVEALPTTLDARVALADVELAHALSERRVLVGPTGAPAMPVMAALFG
jgi:hypothetical protein